MPVEADTWVCPSCAATVGTPWCGHCSEKRPETRSLSLRAFALDAFHALTDIDGRLLRSFRTLLTRPGELTLAHLQGRRVSWLGPVNVFLIANVVFYLVQAVTHSSIFASSLDSHLHEQDWRNVAQTLVAHRLQSKGTDLEHYAPLFDLAAIRNAKALVALMVLPFALLLYAFYPGRGVMLVGRVVFSLHFYAFLMLLFSVALCVAGVSVLAGGPGLHSPAMDVVLTLANLAGCILYLHFALGRVFPSAPVARAACAAVLGAVVVALMIGYRFVIFIVTLYTT